MHTSPHESCPMLPRTSVLNQAIRRLPRAEASLHRRFRWAARLVAVLLWTGCAMTKPLLQVPGIDRPLAPGTILDTRTGETITFGQLIDRLAAVRVVYVGERHTDAAHHAIQLRILQALADRNASLGVGMEMFDHTYQPKLDQWSAGAMDWPTFLKQVHWYANWRYNDALYKEILTFIQMRHLKLVGLNIPFCLPPKISIGGLASLSPADRALLPEQIDTSDPAHRAYVEEIFQQHHLRGRDDFENFYEAQCAWEDGMAQAVADNLKACKMLVLAGSGHIVRKFGIPKRAFARTHAAFLTLLPVYPDENITRHDADFIWVTEAHPHGLSMP
jgi:uncharacterized iron-regulated protein